MSGNRVIPSLSVLLVILLVAGCATTRQAWNVACQANTPEAYDAFTSAHPRDALADSARARAVAIRLQRLDSEWDTVSRRDALGEYLSFAIEHIGTAPAERAVARIDAIITQRGTAVAESDRQLIDSAILATLRRQYTKYAGNLIYQTQTGDRLTMQITASNVLYSAALGIAYIEQAQILDARGSHAYRGVCLWHGTLYEVPAK